MGTLQKLFGDGTAQRERPAAAPDCALEPSERLADRYVVRALLGRGGMGEVYLVEEASTGALRAAKVLRARASASLADLQSFRREAVSLLNLGTHPFVIRLYELHDLGRDTLLVMEYVAPDNGCTSLQDFIARTSDYTDSMLGTWAVEFCVGMEHAISAGIEAHRDIKPANILVGVGPFLKIADFGLALAATRHPSVIGGRSAVTSFQRLRSAEAKMVCGTPGYIAPEIFAGSGKAGAQSDMFSFGVTLWQLAARTLQMPFEARFSGDIDGYQMRLYREALARRIRQVETPFLEVIRRCLDPEPSMRYASFPALREDIKAALKRNGLRAMDFIVKPGFRGTLDEYVSRARGYLVLGRRARALRLLDRAVEHDASSLPARLVRGDVYLEMGDPYRALNEFTSAQTLEPDSDSAAIGMARAHLDTGQDEAAERVLAPVLKRHPQNTEARLQHASMLSRRGQHDAALKLIDGVLQDVPDHATAHEFRGRALWTKGNLLAAKDALMRSLAADPMRVSAGLVLATVMGELQDFASEQQAYDRLIARYRSEPEILNEVAVHMSENGRPERAVPLFRLAAEVDGGTEAQATALVNQGNALLNMGDREGARAEFASAIQASPRYALAHARLGEWEMDHGDPRRGAELLTAAADLEPSDASHNASAGTALLRLGDFARAQVYLTRSLQLAPKQPLVRYNLAVAHIRQGDASSSLQQLAFAVKEEPRYGRGWYLKAQIEGRAGKVADATKSAAEGLKHASTLSAEEVEGLRALASDLADRG
jgi:serine/threonine protein kinase/Tfp pilus assembly protein PilF